MKILKTALTLALLLMLPVGTLVADVEDVEKLRAEQIKKWGDTSIPKPNEIALKAKAVLDKPIENQSISELKAIAEQSNKAANYVGFILDDYATYYRDNYRYDFVQEKVAPFHDAYVRLSNELKDYRNQSYFNIGRKLAASNNEIEAFFYFRDAYRLSSFTDDKGDHKGMRYLAEQEMKKLMGLSDTGSFVYWK